MKYQSLHAHTKISDGKMSYKGLLDACSEHGIGVVAFTDHDTLPDEKLLRELDGLRNHSTKWILGIELSSDPPREVEGKAPLYDIVGLFVDPKNRGLLEYCSMVKEGRIKKAKEMVKNLSSFGFDIRFSEVLAESGGVSIGRPHIVSALLKKESNIRIMEETAKKMRRDAEHNPALKVKYEKMVMRGRSQYPYVLYLTPNSYIRGIYITRNDTLDHDGTVRLIREAGGVSILAHWFFSKEQVGINILKKLFEEGRLDGAEVVYASDVPEWRSEIIDSMASVDKLCRELGMLRSGGADIHDLEDIEIFVGEAKPGFAEKTVGLAEEIIKRSQPNLDWCSLRG